VFAGWIWNATDPASVLRAPFATFFAATSVAALAGGTVHGFLVDRHARARIVLWRLTLLGLGLVAWAAWTIGARLLLPQHTALLIQIAAGVLALAYAVYMVSVDDRFGVTVAHYLPAAVFLLLAFSLLLVRNRASAPLLAGVAGMVLTFAAAFVQQQSDRPA
jgi:Family of unknown function (DUF6962)